MTAWVECTYKALKEQYELKFSCEADHRTDLVAIVAAYFDVAQLEERVQIFEKTLENASRLLRAQKRFEFGSTSRLEVLNAKVDANTDIDCCSNSITYAKRNLNLILARDLEEDSAVILMLVLC